MRIGKLLKGIKNVDQILEGVKNKIFKSETIEALADERWLICKECKMLDNSGLNCFAYFISDIVEKNIFFKFKSINRIHWNWYHPGSKMELHSDESLDKFFSIVYNLHTNDGGTEFSVNNKNTFYNSIESEALFFPSKIQHKAVPPTKDFNRFSLNIVVNI